MPIIESLLDTDWYKFTMFQFVQNRTLPLRHLQERYAFKCRTPNVPLARIIDKGRLKEELDHVRTLTFRKDELDYVKSIRCVGNLIPVISENIVESLKYIRLPEYELEVVGDTYRIEFPGSWDQAIWWETFCLSIVNELYFEEIRKREGIPPEVPIRVGLERLTYKKALLKVSGAKICGFGTRRRYSRLWQETVVSNLKETMPDQFIGTSNVLLAKIHGLTPRGTMAHELDMGIQGEIMRGSNFEKMLNAHDIVMDLWEELYGYNLRINLPDTFGSDWALSRMTEERMRNWRGERHDSGDPYHFADSRIERWRSFDIDPKGKVIMFSDGLEVDPIVNLHGHYRDKVQPIFGWGTGLTNDVGYKPLSIVVKLVESNGFHTVKLSDNLAKATGRPEDIERFKKLFGYTGDTYEQCKY